MVLTAAEKQKKYRLKRDDDKTRRAENLEKDRLRWHKNRDNGKTLSIDNMSNRGKRAKRKQWRTYKITERKHKEQMKMTQISSCPNVSEQPPSPCQSQAPGQKKAKKRSKQSKENHRLKNQIRISTMKCEMYRKRWERVSDSTKKTSPNQDTPKTKTRNLLKHFSSKTARRTLLFHHALIDQIKQNYKKGKTQKRTIADILAGNIIRKYKMKTYARKEVNMCSGKRKFHKKSNLSSRLKAKVQKFFEKDENSQILTGQKKTITKNKIKKQKRLLLDKIETLHQKFKTEHNEKISFTTFWRLKPFWIVQPRDQDRDTCLCKKCENVKYMAEALQKVGELETSNIEYLLKQVACCTDNLDCMHGKCNVCKEKKSFVENDQMNKQVKWNQWRSKKEKRNIKGEDKIITLTVKEEETGSVRDLWKKLNSELLLNHKRHIYNIRNQYKHYRNLKTNLKDTEVFVHVDFAENYVGKQHKEIQSMHFGASKSQISLHTGYYQISSNPTPVSFCGVSDSLRHDPPAIWVHMTPIIDKIKADHPSVTHVHFYSDGPCSQYRQKGNFHLFSEELYKHGFKGGSWNFHEAGHGKGIPDGIGATVKQMADRIVGHGKDIQDAKTLVKELKSAKCQVHLYQIEETAIKQKENKRQLKSIPGTMKIHQITLDETTPGLIHVRDVSCICTENTCKGHEFRQFEFPITKKANCEKQGLTDETVKNLTTGNCNLPKSDKTIVKPCTKHHTEKESKPRRTKLQTEKETVIYTNKQKRQLTEKESSSCNKKRKQTLSNKNKPTQISDKEPSFSEHLKTFQSCKTFAELETQCQIIKEHDNMKKPLEGKQRFIIDDVLDVDDLAMDVCPDDIPGDTIIYPAQVRANGDCLPATGSVFAYGNDDNTDEIRVKIVAELILNKAYYLNEENLKKGLNNMSNQKNIKKAFAIYSDEFVPGIELNDGTIENIYEHEVMKITKEKTFMGIFQIFALASILGMSILSMYPKLGNPNVRKDIHRLIEPRQKHTNDVAHILWTSTRKDMSLEHWVPNHFVPVLPIYKQNYNDISLGEQSQSPEQEMVGTIEISQVVETEDEITVFLENKNIEEDKLSTSRSQAPLPPSTCIPDLPTSETQASFTPSTCIPDLPTSELQASFTPSTCIPDLPTSESQASFTPSACIPDMPTSELQAPLPPSTCIPDLPTSESQAPFTPSTCKPDLPTSESQASFTPSTCIPDMPTSESQASFTPSTCIPDLPTSESQASFTPSTCIPDLPTSESQASFTPSACIPDLPTSESQAPLPPCTCIPDMPTSESHASFTRSACIPDMPTPESQASFTPSACIPDMPTSESQASFTPSACIPDMPTSESQAPLPPSTCIPDLPTSESQASFTPSACISDLPTSESQASFTPSACIPDMPTSESQASFTPSPCIPDMPTSESQASFTPSACISDLPTSESKASFTPSPCIPNMLTSESQASFTPSPCIPDMPTSESQASLPPSTCIPDLPTSESQASFTPSPCIPDLTTSESQASFTPSPCIPELATSESHATFTPSSCIPNLTTSESQASFTPSPCIPDLTTSESHASLNPSPCIDKLSIKGDGLDCCKYRIGQYVIVVYENEPYPGVILKVCNNEVYIECMKRVNTQMKNCFYWPKRKKDKCWYHASNILAIFEQPFQMENSKFEIDQNVWDQIMKKNNTDY